MTKRDLIIFFSLAFMWSLSFIFYRVGVPEFGSLSFSSLRVVFAALTMLIFVSLNANNRKGIREHFKLLAIIGLCTAVIPFTLFAFAAQSVNAGVLAVLNASVPMISGFIASTFFNDKLSRKQILGLVIGVGGVVILMSEHLFPGLYPAVSSASASGIDTTVTADFKESGTLNSGLVPIFYALLACVGYAVGANLTRNFLEHVSPIAITSGSLIIAGIVMLPIAIYEFPYGQSISMKAWVSVVCIGIFSTAIALIFMNQLIKSIGAMRATSITLVIPIFAIFFGYVLLDEALDIGAIIGSIVILIGTYLSLNLSIKGLVKS